jgi:hypothetical protein
MCSCEHFGVDTTASLHLVRQPDHFYVAYLKDDPAKEPIAAGESIPGIIADASAKIGRPRNDFEVLEIDKNRFERLKRFV